MVQTQISYSAQFKTPIYLIFIQLQFTLLYPT